MRPWVKLVMALPVLMLTVGLRAQDYSGRSDAFSQAVSDLNRQYALGRIGLQDYQQQVQNAWNTAGPGLAGLSSGGGGGGGGGCGGGGGGDSGGGGGNPMPQSFNQPPAAEQGVRALGDQLRSGAINGDQYRQGVNDLWGGQAAPEQYLNPANQAMSADISGSVSAGLSDMNAAAAQNADVSAADMGAAGEDAGMDSVQMQSSRSTRRQQLNVRVPLDLNGN